MRAERSAPMTVEKDLVAQCQASAKAMNAFLCLIGQRGKQKGTTIGFPDLVLLCAGKTLLIECKRPKTAEHPAGYLTMGQHAFVLRAQEQDVYVHVIETVGEFEELVNSCRRRVPVR